MTAPAVDTVMPPEGLRVTPAGTPVLPAAGYAVLVAVVVVVDDGVLLVVVELDGVLVVCGLGYQVRLGCDVCGAPMATTGCTAVSVICSGASAFCAPTDAALAPPTPTARAAALVSRGRRGT